MAMRLLAPCIAALALHSVSLAAERAGVFLIESDSQSIRLSDQGELPSARLLVAATVQAVDVPAAPPARRPSGMRAASAPDRQLAAVVQAAATAYRLAPELLHAVISIESGYVPRAVSSRGALGLMQLMPSTAQTYGVTDPFDPRQNIYAGAQHLRRLLDQFGQDTRLALAAYNAGAAAVIRHRHSIPPFAETTAYVPRVLKQMAQLHQPSTPTQQTP